MSPLFELKKLPRRISLFFFCLAINAGGICSVSAEEWEPAILWNLQSGLSLMNFDYREFEDAGRLLDRESGSIPGIVFDLAGAKDRWTVGGRFSWHADDVLYDGQTTTGIPIRTRTEENILDTSVRIERSLDSDFTPGLTVYGGFGYRYWGREIRPTYTSSGQRVDGLFEMYRWTYLFVGGKTAVYRTDRFRGSLDARVLRPYNPTVEVDYRGTYDAISLDLGERTSWRLGIPIELRIDERIWMVVEPYAEAWDLGRSPTETLTRQGVPVGRVYEPRSTTRSTGLVVGFRFF